MLILILILLPLVGTTLGAAAVLLGRTGPSADHRGSLGGFAAGVMTAASVWSLLLPALEQSQGLAVPSFFPALVGIWAGFLFLDVMDRLLGPEQEDSMLYFAVALHNLPEGMAVGAALAAWHSAEASFPAVAALSAGIAIQNLPEGAIISLPLAAQGVSKSRALRAGFLSGVIEPIGAILTLLFAELALPALPYLLSFSAGAMLSVTVRELVPKAARTRCGTLWFAAGFSLMMVLDVALG